MNSLIFLPLLPPEHREPNGLSWHFFTNRHGRQVRFARLSTARPLARVVYTGGLSQPVECDFENLVSLHKMGLDVYHLERFGKAGSERMYANLHKPAALPIRYFAQDLVDFIHEQLPGDETPLYFLGSCYGGLIGLESCRIEPYLFDGLFSAFYAKNGGEGYSASLHIGPHNETQY